MTTRYAKLWLLLALTCLEAGAAPLIVPSAPQLAAGGYLLLDADSGRILAARNTEQRLPPASLTKIMTSYVVSEELSKGSVSLDDKVYISVNAWRREGSRMFVREGTKVRLEDLLRGVIIQSGNDASVALAEYVAGSEEGFTDMMNQHAQRLGMHNTNFENATGLPHDNHYTTASDLAKLARALINNHPRHYHIYREKRFTYNDITQTNRNLLLWRDPSVDGVKTGHTKAAGFCLLASAERKGMRLISVVMNSSSVESRTRDSQKLLNYGFRFFETYRLHNAGDVLRQARIYGGTRAGLQLGMAEDLVVTLPRGSKDDLKVTLDFPSVLRAPVQKGEEVGQVTLRDESKVLQTFPLQALNQVPEAGFFGRTRDNTLLYLQELFGMDTSSVD